MDTIDKIFKNSAKAELLELLAEKLETMDKAIIVLIQDENEEAGEYSSLVENLEGESLPAITPSKLPNNKNTPKHGRLPSTICGNNDTDGIINSEISEADMARLVRMCPSCRSWRMKKYDIYRYGRTSRTRYRCESCGKLTIYPLMKLVAERKKKK